MPKYSFECQDCALRFERNLKTENHVSHVCPSCGEVSPRVMEGFSFAFSAPAPGTPTANTGVHDQDYPTADKLIGRDADRRWELLAEREKAKDAARQQGGTHALIRRDTEEFTEYRPMTDVGRDARRKLARYAIDKVRANRSTKP